MLTNLRWSVIVLVLATAAPRVSSAQSAPYPPSGAITSVTFDFSTHVRLAPGSDNWPLTWADDDAQYTSWGDGGGFSGTDATCRVSLGFGRIDGPSSGFAGHDVWGDPACADHPAQFTGKTRTVLSIGGTLYSWVSDGSDVSGLDFQKLYKSTDHAATWTDTGVQWTYATDQIGLFAFLEFGKDYQGARDNYVYIYATHIQSYTWGTQKPGQIYLLRVPTAQIETQSAYQFFTGFDSGGNPLWGTKSQRQPVFSDPEGVMRNSAIYDPGLGRYLLVTNHSQNNGGNIGIFDAPQPWGPWTTVYYVSGWPQGGEVEQNVFFANFSPKWWSDGGRKFVFVFTGKNTNDSFNSVEGSFQTPGAEPVGHWAFDEGSGTLAMDSSGGGNNGTLTNGPVWTTGPLAGALAFDGANDYVQVNDPGSGSPLDLASDFTVGAWVRFNALPVSGSASNPRLLQKSGNTSAAGSYYLSARTSDAPDVLSLRLKFAGKTYTLDGAQSLAPNQWYHAAAVKQGTSVRLYVNGVQDGATFSVPAGAPDANDDPLYFGESPGNSNGALDGALDDLRLYDRALSAAEVTQLATVVPDSMPPSMPVILSATPVSATRIDLTWSPSSDVDNDVASYRVDRNGTTVGSTLAATSYADTTLQPNTTYTYVVTAVDETGLSSPPSPAVDATTHAAVNLPPTVDAGADQIVALPSTIARLVGTVSDDGLPSGTLTTRWSVVSGPGTVAFEAQDSATTAATFPTLGTYVLRFTASDGALTASDDVQVDVSTTYLAFDGVDDQVQVNDPGSGSALDLASDFTIGAWVRFSALPTSGSGSSPRILQKSSDTGAAGSYYLSVRTSGGPPALSLRLKFGGTTYTLTGVQPLITGRWYHVAAVKQGTSVRLYVDGVQDGATFSVPAGAPDANDDPLYLGESPGNSNGALNGALDDLRLYNRALSDSEIVVTKDIEASGAEAGLALYLPLDEGSGQTVASIAPGGFSGWLGSSTVAESVDPAWATGASQISAAPVTPNAAGVAALRMDPARPNPLSLSTTLVVHSDRSVAARVEVYDVRGRLVKILLPGGTIQAGSTSFVWDGSTEARSNAAAGVYFIRLRAGDASLTQRVIRLK